MGKPGGASDRPLDVRFEITIVRGEAGRRLAALQAEAILDVLIWLRRNNNAVVDADSPVEPGDAVRPHKPNPTAQP